MSDVLVLLSLLVYFPQDTVEPDHQFKCPRAHVFSGAVSEDGKRFVVCDASYNCCCFSLKSKELRTEEVYHPDFRYIPFRYMAFLSSDSLIGCGYDKKRGWVTIWNVTTWECQAHWEAHDSPIYAGALPPDRKSLATGSNNGIIKIWDIASHKLVASLPPTEVPSDILMLQYIDDGKSLVSVDKRGIIKRWNCKSWKCELTINTDARPRHTSMLRDSCVVLSDRGDFVGGPYNLQVWDVTTGKAVASELTDFTGVIGGIAQSPDTKWLVIWTRRGNIGELRLWDTASLSEKSIVTIEGQNIITNITFSPDGLNVMIGDCDGVVRLFSFKQLRQSKL